MECPGWGFSTERHSDKTKQPMMPREGRLFLILLLHFDLPIFTIRVQRSKDGGIPNESMYASIRGVGYEYCTVTSFGRPFFRKNKAFHPPSSRRLSVKPTPFVMALLFPYATSCQSSNSPTDAWCGPLGTGWSGRVMPPVPLSR